MATFGCPPVNSICSTGIDGSYVQTVQTDSALTTSFGRHDFIGVITDDSVKRLKWGRPPASGKLPTRL
jgi:hypothetical protein